MDQAELIDREKIRDCLYLYCRGIDRADEAALRACYWPEATDSHGPYQGSADGFIAWAMQSLPLMERSIHHIHNILMTFRPDGAAVESSFTAIQRQPGADGAMHQYDLAGRYLDWFEKRGAEWRVLRRLVVYDRVEEMPLPPGTEAERFGPRTPIGGTWPDDPFYRL